MRGELWEGGQRSEDGEEGPGRREEAAIHIVSLWFGLTFHCCVVQANSSPPLAVVQSPDWGEHGARKAGEDEVIELESSPRWACWKTTLGSGDSYSGVPSVTWEVCDGE